MHLVDLDTVDSTQAEARRRWQAGALHAPAVVVARAQTAGRGTSGRIWVSPHGLGLYISIVDAPAVRTGPALRGLVLAGAFATADWLAERFGVQTGIKPLNDIYALGRKLGGVLVEAHAEAERVGVVITGIGLNLRAAPGELADGTSAISLADLGVAASAIADPAPLARELADRVIRWNRLALAADGDPMVAAWARFGLPGAACPGFEQASPARTHPAQV